MELPSKENKGVVCYVNEVTFENHLKMISETNLVVRELEISDPTLDL